MARAILTGQIFRVHTDDNKTLFFRRSRARHYTGPDVYAIGERIVFRNHPGQPPGPPTGNYTNPGSLSSGDYEFNSTQLGYAIGILSACDEVPGGNNDTVRIAALACAIVESVLLMYANVYVPDSYNYPHDRVGSDGESVGLFQQQSQYGWGTTAQLMSVKDSTRSFLGGDYSGSPRGGSWPLGLLDIDYRSYATIGSAVQAVQISAFPDRYDEAVAVAQAILSAVRA